MRRGTACVIAAACLLSAAAPAPDQRADHQQRAAAQRMQQAVESIAASQGRIADATQPGEYERPCREGEKNRNSDLCAQWEAATAAGDSARWAYWAFLLNIVAIGVSVVGTLFVLLTLRAANRTLEATIRAERPHLRYYGAHKTYGRHWLTRRRVVRSVDGIILKNYGRTPAIMEAIWIEYALAEKPPLPMDCRFKRPFSDDQIVSSDELWPRGYYVPPLDAQGTTLAALIAGHNVAGRKLYVFGHIHYRDAFGNRYETGFSRVFNGLHFAYNQSDISDRADLNYAD